MIQPGQQMPWDSIAENAIVLSVHIGVDIHSKNLDSTLLWSRRGLETVIENRSQYDIFSSLSLEEAANLTIDRNIPRALDNDFMTIFPKPNKIVYIQCYNTSPCYKPKDFHSCSGVLACTRTMHSEVISAIVIFLLEC